MKYSIAFSSLPFEPEARQVIYVENQYDEQINALIKDNYKQIKWVFERARLDFIYLPMFFNDEKTREKVLYYAPYLTTEIMEKAELRSGFLLSYMSHLDNREKISPSFIYSPHKESEEWIFQGQSIDLKKKDKNTIIQLVESITSEIEEEISAFRPKREIRYDEDHGEGILYRSDEMWDVEEPQVEYSSTPSLWDKVKRGLKQFSKPCLCEEEEGSASIANEPLPSSLDEIREEDVRETIEELEKNIERLRLLGIPLAVIAEFVSKYETISRLRLTDDLRIFLPDYDNLEVKMGPIYKAVYFLFLNNPEGIILQRLEDHHHELVNYYLQTSNRTELSPHMTRTIHNLEYPGDNAIHVVLSRIRAYFKATIDEHLAKNYYIVGRPGEPYRIALSQELIEWENEE